jgi:hypothetical protein
MGYRRTTVVAESSDLDLLAREGRERRISLGRLIGELVAARAAQVRRQRRPQVSTIDVEMSVADAAEAENPAARPFR